jgi:signal transduction histidine kinase
MQTSTESNDPRMAALSDAEELIDRLQAEAESQRATLSRAIHDDLGGLMVSAAMDFTSVGQHLLELAPPIRRQLDRGRETLESAIDMSRRMVEELRPSILDNFGLFAALKWQLKQASEGSNAKLTENYPATEPNFQPAALTALFRLAQEAIAMIFKRRNLGAVNLNLQIENAGITMRFTDDGTPELVDGREVGAAGSITSMKHRIRALGGTVDLLRREDGVTVLTAHLPLPEIYAPDSSA